MEVSVRANATQPDRQDIHFPKAGIDRSRAFDRQPAREVDGQYARTCYLGQNVRSRDRDGRYRGGSRCGLSKYLPARPGGFKWITQHLNTIVFEGDAAPGGGAVQLSNSGRVVSLVAVARGNVYSTVPGALTWTAATNSSGETPPLNQSGLIRSAANNQLLFFVDGTNYRYFNPATNTVHTWTATRGTLPIDDHNRKAKLICTWRGRTVVSGLPYDPHNWFMSRIADPFDYLYQSDANDSAQAIAGNNAPAGLIGDVVTSLIPHSDDVLVFGGDSTIWAMRGDPYGGGNLDNITDAIGISYGEPWCRDERGALYFFGNTGGIYAMDPRTNAPPTLVSGPIDQLTRAVNTGDYSVCMEWHDPLGELHVWVTKLASAQEAVHFTWERDAKAWWTDTYRKKEHNPLVCCTVDGNRPEDRSIVIGSWDGYVRQIDPDATTDDNQPIDQEVIVGPLTTPTMDEIRVEESQAVLGEGSEDVTAEYLVGHTPEQALASEPVEIGTWSAGRNLVDPVRVAGHAVYIRITTSAFWAMEAIRLRVQTLGKVRRRS
jgi:hypothetical protein